MQRNTQKTNMLNARNENPKNSACTKLIKERKKNNYDDNTTTSTFDICNFRTVPSNWSIPRKVANMLGIESAADPGGAGRRGHSPTPVKTSQKKDGRRAGPQVS